MPLRSTEDWLNTYLKVHLVRYCDENFIIRPPFIELNHHAAFIPINA